MIDGHMHLEYGPLSKEYVMEFINKAVEKGFDEIQILDHTHRFIEFAPMYEDLKEEPHQKIWLEKKKLEPLDTYINLIKEMKQMDLPIKVKFGLEVCHTPKGALLIQDILSRYDFDFVVGAIHSIDGLLYDMNFSKSTLWEQYDVDHIYKRYYELVFDLIDSNLYTQLAHPDTIKLFDYYPTYDLTSTYTRMAKLLNEHNMKCENNTGCHYRYGHKDVGLSPELLKILRDYNVKMITASDAHHPDDVGTDIPEIWEATMK